MSTSTGGYGGLEACFVITHGQSTLANWDRVLTLRDGRLTELAQVASGGQA